MILRQRKCPLTHHNIWSTCIQMHLLIKGVPKASLHLVQMIRSVDRDLFSQWEWAVDRAYMAFAGLDSQKH